MGGNGPLLELASLSEYAAPAAPGIVLWFFVESNDFIGLRRELGDPVLRQYLAPEFSQGLLDRQPEIDGIHRAFIAAAETSLRAHEGWSGHELFAATAGFLRLERLRLVTRWIRSNRVRRGTAGEPTGEELATFAEILALARDRVAGWGGELYLVYLPSWQRFAFPPGVSGLGFREDVLQIAARQGVPTIDVLPAFQAHPDPLSLFPFRYQGHYTAAGYALTAATITGFLQDWREPAD
jgi:hypothetical protein